MFLSNGITRDYLSELVAERLAQKIDEDRKDMTFRFSVKATVVTGDAG